MEITIPGTEEKVSHSKPPAPKPASEQPVIQAELETAGAPPAPAVSFTCRLCGHVASSQSALAAHMRHGHTRAERETLKVTEKNKTVPCPKCEKLFAGQKGLNIHMGLSHPAAGAQEPALFDKRVQCPYCESLFVNARGLNHHITSAHKKAGPASVCAECNRAFISPHALRTHILRAHGKGWDTTKNLRPEKPAPAPIAQPPPRPQTSLTTLKGQGHRYYGKCETSQGIHNIEGTRAFVLQSAALLMEMPHFQRIEIGVNNE